MAEIKGLTLKSVTNFKGHAGEPCKQGAIYLNGKKVGYYSDDFNMGPSEIRFDNRETEKEVLAICKAYFEENPKDRWCYGTDYADKGIELEEIFTVLIELIDFEKEYKKMLKKGYGIFAVYKHEGYRIQMSGFKSLEYAKKHLLEEKKVENPKFYSSLEDFKIK